MDFVMNFVKRLIDFLFPRLRKLLQQPGVGWQNIKPTLRRPKKPDGPTMTFGEILKKYRVSEERLQESMVGFRKRRRLLTVLGWFNLGLFLLGFPLLHLNMIILGFLSAVVCFLYAALAQLRLWQCQRRELAGIEAFLADRSAFFQVFLW